jgi:hypothetical protein
MWKKFSLHLLQRVVRFNASFFFRLAGYGKKYLALPSRYLAKKIELMSQFQDLVTQNNVSKLGGFLFTTNRRISQLNSPQL